MTIDTKALRELLADEKRAEEHCDSHPSPDAWRELAVSQEALNEAAHSQLPAILDRLENLEAIADAAREFTRCASHPSPMRTDPEAVLMRTVCALDTENG